MIIGTDRSIKVCQLEGYTLISYDGRKKFRRDLPMSIIQGYLENPTIECIATWDDLMEQYTRSKEEIDSLTEVCNYLNTENPGHYDFLHLADAILAYGNIDGGRRNAGTQRSPFGMWS